MISNKFTFAMYTCSISICIATFSPLKPERGTTNYPKGYFASFIRSLGGAISCIFILRFTPGGQEIIGQIFACIILNRKGAIRILLQISNICHLRSIGLSNEGSFKPIVGIYRRDILQIKLRIILIILECPEKCGMSHIAKNIIPIGQLFHTGDSR